MATGIDIIIPTKNNTDYLFDCISSIVDKTHRVSYHIYVCDTGSTKEEISQIQTFLKENFSKDRNATLLKFNYYHFAKINNAVVTKHSKNPVLLFCNNDIKLIDNCIDVMYDCVVKDDTGTVGCRLIFPDENVQHAGQAIKVREQTEGNLYIVTHRGYGTKEKYKDNEDVLGNTGGFLMIQKQVFVEAGMFNEIYKECFEDVELNIKLLLGGRRNVYFDSVCAYHYESLTRDKINKQQGEFYDFKHFLTPFFDSLSDREIYTICQFQLDKAPVLVL